MTALVPSNTNVTSTDLEKVLKGLTNQKPQASQIVSKRAKPVAVKKESQEAISRLSERLGAVKLPSEARLLTQEEKEDALALGYDAKLVKAATEKAVEYVKQAVFNHLDIELENQKDEDEELPLDEKGNHYLVKGQIEVGGYKLVRQLSEGAPTVTAEDLKALWDANKITRDVYYRATRKPDVPRVTDEAGLLEVMADPKVMEAIKEIIQPGKVTASFWIRPLGEED